MSNEIEDKFRFRRIWIALSVLLILALQVYLAKVALLVYTDWLGEYPGQVGRNAHVSPIYFFIAFIPLKMQMSKWLRRPAALCIHANGVMFTEGNETKVVAWKNILDVNGTKHSRILGFIPWRPGVTIRYQSGADISEAFVSPIHVDFRGIDVVSLTREAWLNARNTECRGHKV